MLDRKKPNYDSINDEKNKRGNNIIFVCFGEGLKF